MTSHDGLALLEQMHQRGEITDEQYDTLRRHVLRGTPPQSGGGAPAPSSGPVPPERDPVARHRGWLPERSKGPDCKSGALTRY